MGVGVGGVVMVMVMVNEKQKQLGTREETIEACNPTLDKTEQRTSSHGGEHKGGGGTNSTLNKRKPTHHFSTHYCLYLYSGSSIGSRPEMLILPDMVVMTISSSAPSSIQSTDAACR